MKNKKTIILVEESKQLVAEEDGEQIQDQELAQQIGQLIEVIDMEFEHEPQNEDTNLMTRAHEVTSQSPPPLVSEPILSEKEEVVLLDDDLVMDV